ncbi:hypothetical protein [Neorhodopirellula pilleata]|uniref:hypothetical protein n=1 Tax=Neorhodopirellula pilleata TaxID=2714738 RepID=UPI0011B6791E|nr:hypothetical protein [Neorhodopirellula pilleata]
MKVCSGDRGIVEHWGGDEPLDGVVRLVEPSPFLTVSALGVEEERVSMIADFTDPFQQRESLGDGFRVDAKIVSMKRPRSQLASPPACYSAGAKPGKRTGSPMASPICRPSKSVDPTAAALKSSRASICLIG